MLDQCFNCGEEIDDELDTYAVLVGMSGRINFCESCGKNFNISNWHNKKIAVKCDWPESIPLPTDKDIKDMDELSERNTGSDFFERDNKIKIIKAGKYEDLPLHLHQVIDRIKANVNKPITHNKFGNNIDLKLKIRDILLGY